MALGENLRQARLRRGWTQEELAYRVCVQARGRPDGIRTSGSDISNYERNKHVPRTELVAALAAVLGTSVDSLVGSGSAAGEVVGLAADFRDSGAGDRAA